MSTSGERGRQREKVVAIACNLVAARGLEGLTVRTVASAAGCSTAVVSHYFHNKRELLLLTYEYAARRTVTRAGDPEPVPQSLWRFLVRVLPIDKLSQDNWRVFVAFWGAASGDPAMADRQRYHVHDARAAISGFLRTQHFAGRDDDFIEETARRLLAAVMGIAVQAVFDPADWPADRQLRTLTGAFDTIVGAA